MVWFCLSKGLNSVGGKYASNISEHVNWKLYKKQLSRVYTFRLITLYYSISGTFGNGLNCVYTFVFNDTTLPNKFIKAFESRSFQSNVKWKSIWNGNFRGKENATVVNRSHGNLCIRASNRVTYNVQCVRNIILRILGNWRDTLQDGDISRSL